MADLDAIVKLLSTLALIMVMVNIANSLQSMLASMQRSEAETVAPAPPETISGREPPSWRGRVWVR